MSLYTKILAAIDGAKVLFFGTEAVQSQRGSDSENECGESHKELLARVIQKSLDHPEERRCRYFDRFKIYDTWY